MEKFTNPLRQQDIDRITVKQNGTEQTAIEKTEAPYSQTEQWQLESESLATEGERDTVLVVSKLSFKEDTKWTFFERGATVIAKIEDQEFWADVHSHKLTFGEGDRLRVRFQWKIEKKKTLIPKSGVKFAVFMQISRKIRGLL